MKFVEMMNIVGAEPVFESGLLLAGDIDPGDVRRQLSLWVKSGKLYQLRRGVYALAPPYQKTPPHPFLIANKMVRGSYVSLQSALAYYDLIPEHVTVTLSVSTGRPVQWDTPLGWFEFRHITSNLYTDYQQVGVASNQHAFIATPEKALLDLIHLTPGGDSPDYLAGLRLHNLSQLDLGRLHKLASLPKLRRAVDVVSELMQLEEDTYETL